MRDDVRGFQTLLPRFLGIVEDGNEGHENRSYPELAILLLNLAYSSHHLPFSVLQDVKHLTFRAVLDDERVQVAADLHQVVILGGDREAEQELSELDAATQEPGICAASAMDCYPEFALVVGSHVVRESRQDGEEIDSSCLLTFQPVSAQPVWIRAQ